MSDTGVGDVLVVCANARHPEHPCMYTIYVAKERLSEDVYITGTPPIAFYVGTPEQGLVPMRCQACNDKIATINSDPIRSPRRTFACHATTPQRN